MAELKEKGAEVDDTILSLKEAEEEIYRFLTRNR